MRLARLSLILTALVFGGFGGWLLLWPETLSLLGVELTTPAARTEIRGFYGGLELGFALFFAVAASRTSWYAPALVAQAASLGGTAVGRVFGILVDGGTEPLTLMLLTAEGTGCFVGVLALMQLPRQPNPVAIKHV